MWYWQPFLPGILMGAQVKVLIEEDPIAVIEEGEVLRQDPSHFAEVEVMTESHGVDWFSAPCILEVSW